MCPEPPPPACSAATSPPVGRFAPSPTGPLHLGSVVAALGSCLEARKQQGLWRLRLEDLDTARCIPGMDTVILQTLDALGFEWDGPVVWQTRSLSAYETAFEQLRARDAVYPCACSRKTLAALGVSAYPGTCRAGLLPGQQARAWRLLTDDRSIVFEDALQGVWAERLSRSCGDFVLKRADGFFAYQLAVVVDDARCGVTHVVRGADLLSSTARQCWLQQQLGLPRPRYAHLPLVRGADGDKLSKQTGARDVREAPAAETLCQALRHLGQNPPQTLFRAGVREVWAWAHQHWTRERVPGFRRP